MPSSQYSCPGAALAVYTLPFLFLVMGIKPGQIKLFIRCVLFSSGYCDKWQTVNGLSSKLSFPSVQEARKGDGYSSRSVSLVTALPLAQMAFCQSLPKEKQLGVAGLPLLTPLILSRPPHHFISTPVPYREQPVNSLVWGRRLTHVLHMHFCPLQCANEKQGYFVNGHPYA